MATLQIDNIRQEMQQLNAEFQVVQDTINLETEEQQLVANEMTQSVYAWGANSHGQLGLGYESELCMTPQRLTKCSFNPSQVRCIRGGGGHVIVLDNLGRVHTCGWNNRGQLGLDSMEDCHSEFQQVPSEFFDDLPINFIACGWDISGCITVTKKLFVWGSNAFQQLGICQRGFVAVRRPLPVILPRNELVLRISFGLRHCAILTEDHIVFVFGRLRANDPTPSELCVTSTILNRANVMKIKPNNPKELLINSMSSGQNHLLLRVTDLQVGNGNCHGPRRIIALGDNKYGQANSFYFDDVIRQVSVGWTHNAVLLKDNRILLWGRNCYGQLGMGSMSETKPTPVELNLSDDIVPAWLHLGSEHCLLRTITGTVYTWGWNEHGNCGNGSTDNLYTPTLIDLPAKCRIAGAGAGFCYAICENPASS